MKHKLRNLAWIALSVTASLSVITVQAADEDLHNQAQQTIANFQAQDSTLRAFMENAAGFAVFPDVGKGGFIVGGARGKGLLFEKGEVTGQVTMTQGSIGAQAGGQSFAEIIVFQTPQALSDFKTGHFQLSAEVGAVVVRQGASKSAQYKDGVAVFTMPKKGLMVSAAVGGQKFRFEPLTPTGR